MRNEIQYTDEQIEELFDDALPIDEIEFTRDTIDDFLEARPNWAERGEITDDEDTEDGLGVLVIDRAQFAKGDRRCTIHIIDFGTVRGVVKF